MWAVGAVGVVGAVWVVWGGVGGDHRTLKRKHVRGWGGGFGGGEEGTWAVGAVGEMGTLVKAQNHTKQEGAPPSADPGGSADRIMNTNIIYVICYVYTVVYI